MRLFEDHKHIANHLNSYFTYAGPISLIRYHDQIAVLLNIFTMAVFNRLSLAPTTFVEIQDFIIILKDTKSDGCSDIPIFLIKTYVHLMLRKLVNIDIFVYS